MGGGNRSSSDVASASSSKSGSRRKDSRSSTTSRKSSRGDDRERGLGDLAAYSSSGSRKYGAGEADPSVTIDSDRMIIERTPKRKSGDGDRRDSDRDRDNKSARRRDRERSSRDLGSRSKGKERSVDDPGDDFDRSSRRERRRTQPGDPYPPPLNTNIPTSGAGEQFAADINAPGFSQFPGMQYDSMVPGATMPDHSGSPAAFDPHVHQQFPGQFPDTVAEPYRPPNPAGEAAEYYGDQGQSVSEQPGVRPNLPAVIPNSQAHLLPASPVVNPPPEPSSVGQVGAAAAYYADDDLQSQPSQQSGRPPRPSKPNQSSHGLGSATVAGAAAYGVGSALHSHSNSGSRPPSYPGSPAEPSNMAQPPMSGIDRPPHSHSIGPGPGIAAAGAAAYGVGNTLHGHSDSGSRPPSYPQSPAEPSHMAYAQPPMSGPGKPSHSHSMGPGVGLAAAGAAAGYMMGHHHHSSSSPEHPAQYTMQDYEHPSHGATPIYGPNINPALFGAGAAGAAGYGAAHGMHTHGQGPAFPSGGLAFQQRRRGPLDRLVDFWRDPEGVGMFEDYTETIGVCRYCFDPGTTSRDAPRKHHYHRRRSWDRHSNGSRVEKLSRFTSSEDESRRRRKSKKKSWLPALLAGYAAKSIFTNKDFDDTYSVKSGRVVTPKGSFRDNESVSTLDRKSQTSHGVCRRSGHSPSRGSSYSDLKRGRYEGYHKRSRSRSRSSSRSNRHSALRNAALGAAVGGVAYAATKSHRSHSSSKGKSRKGSSSSSSTSVSSHSDSSLPSRKSVAGGLASFFTAPTKNRTKRGNRKPKGIFSVNNSSSSSLDADLAFGTGVKKPRSGKSGRKGRDEKDLDAKLLGLGATATALAASSHRHNRRTGEILANKDARSRRLDYASSATNDDGWEDLDPGDQSASSVSSGLAFGSGDDSQTSDSGTSKWGWRWGGKKDKKKKRSSSSEHHFPSGAAVAAGLGGAALATAYHSHSKHPSQDNVSESAGSLQHVFPAPTSDPSQFDAVRVPSSSQPTLVRPGPIPLQQPQPVTPVSNAIYTTQGEPTYFTAPSEPPAIGNASSGYYAQYEDSRSGYINQRDLDNSTHSSSSKVRRPHRRSDSSPVFGTESLEGVPTPSLKRRSTTKDQPTVQFDLTEEQARRERRASRRDGDRRDDQFEGGPQLIDREHELALEDADHEKRRRRGREDEARGRDDDYDQAYSRSSRSRRDREGLERRQESGDSSWVGPAVAGTIGAAAAASALSSRSSHNDPSETSQRRHSVRREKRRAERRRGDSRSEMSTISEDVYQPEESSPMGESDKTVRESPSRDSNGRPAHDDYVEFFAPAEVRRSPDKHTQDRDASMPRIVEVEPANERFAREISQLSTGSRNKDSSLPWPVPTLNLIEPTPPQSLNGSVRDTTSPTRFSEERPVEVKPSEQQRSASRVSWGEHQTHEYEVPSSSSERDSADQEGARELDRTRDAAQEEKPRNHGIGTDVEFAATVAAATAAAGFDPSLVTDDPTYHTRSTGPDTKEPIDLSRPEPRGFVEGEVETSDSDSKNKEPSSRNQDNAREAEPEPSAEHLIEGDPIYSEPESLTKGSKGVVQEAEERPSFDGDDSFNMPGGFEFDDSPTESRRERDYHDTSKSDSRSVVSAPVAGDFAALSRSQKSRPSDGDYDEIGDISREPDEDGTEGKKRRKRRSKRDSGSIDDAASVTSSPAKIEATKEKRRSQDGKDKGKSSSGFFSNLFGSRVSEPAEPKRSSSIDGHSSREVKSEIGTGMREEPRRHKRRSSRHRSMDDLGLLEGQGPDQDSKLGDKDDVNLENYKSHRQRREERRRHRHEEIAESGKATDYEKV